MANLRIEDYALIGDCATAALVGRNGSIDWLCLPRFDSPACFAALLGEPEHGRWLIAPSDPNTKVERRYLDGSLVLATTFETAQGAVELIDFFRPRHGPLDLVRLVRGLRGRVAMCVEFILRFEYGSVVAWVARRGPQARWRVRDQRRRPRPVRVDLWPVAPTAAAAGRPRAGLAQRPVFLGTVVRPVRSGRPVDRYGQALARRAEGADLRPDRRHRRGADDLAARADRRPAQLGLPLLLAARRHLYSAGIDECRLLRRGAVMAGLAVSRGRRQPRPDPDNVRARRRAKADRVGSALAAGLRSLIPGAHRQWRGKPDPARHLRRDFRRVLSHSSARPAAGRTRPCDRPSRPRASGRDLGS